MKKIFYLSAIITVFALGASSISYAQDFLASTKTKTDVVKHSLDGERLEVAQGFENAIASLNNLIERIGSCISKMQAAGDDVASSSALFDETKSEIANSANNVLDLENALAVPTSTSTRNVIISRIKTESIAAKISIETSHKSILNLIDMLKQESSSATSSDEMQQATTSSQE